MKTMTILILTMLLYTSCKHEEDMVVISIALELSIIDEDGKDLLNPENPNAIVEGDIKKSYLIDGEIEEVNNPLMDNPRGFRIFKHEHEYRIEFSLNDSESEEYPITYMEWNENDMDTIKCEIEKKSNSTICTKVWFNDELKWESSNQTERFFTIIK